MEKIDQSMQKFAVEKVLDEMKKAENYLKSWNASWYEQKFDAYSPELHTIVGESDVRAMEERYGDQYKLANAFYSGDSIGVPLSKDSLIGNNTLTGEYNKIFDVDFARIGWINLHTNNAIRSFYFYNNGNIEFSKRWICGKSSKKHPNRISYDTSFNVLSNDFEVSVSLDHLLNDHLLKGFVDETKRLSLSIKDDILIEKDDDVDIISNLKTSSRFLRIEIPYNTWTKSFDYDITFEALLNPNSTLNQGSITINTHKSNGKVNGTYRIHLSNEMGLKAMFYSRKGVKKDISNDPELIAFISNILLSLKNPDKHGENIIYNFMVAARMMLANKLTKGTSDFENIDFNLSQIDLSERKIIEMVKCIKGELPLSGLVERIDNCLDFIESIKNQKLDGKVKTLKLN